MTIPRDQLLTLIHTLGAAQTYLAHPDVLRVFGDESNEAALEMAEISGYLLPSGVITRSASRKIVSSLRNAANILNNKKTRAIPFALNSANISRALRTFATAIIKSFHL